MFMCMFTKLSKELMGCVWIGYCSNIWTAYIPYVDFIKVIDCRSIRGIAMFTFDFSCINNSPIYDS